MSEPVPLRIPLQSRSQRTRAVIVEAAMLEFSERGYAETTAKSIAERASVGTGTFYHYFPDKDAVLREITQARVSDLLQRSEALTRAPAAVAPVERLARDVRERLTKLVELYVEYHRSDRGLHAVITERRLCDPRLDDIMAASERAAVARTAETLSQLGYDGHCETAAFMMFSLLEGAVHGHVLGQSIVSDDHFVEGLVEALIRIGTPRHLLPFLPARPRASAPSPRRVRPGKARRGKASTPTQRKTRT